MINTTFTVNGKVYTTEVDETQSLLTYLREELHLYGTKNGCSGKGQCGACTVIFNGESKRACTVKMAKVEGAVIETIENLSKGGELHPVQVGFVNTGAIQCGFCTPGMIMSAKALLDKNSDPTDQEIQTALKTNICRCTGYVAIKDAVRMAGKIMRGEAVEYLPTEGTVGTSVVGKDVVQKAMGLPLFAEDREFPGMIYGKVKYTDHPSAIVKKINVEKALAVPGVIRVLRGKDIPGRKTYGLLNPHQPIMVEEGERIRYIGDPIVTVLAESLKAAEEGAKLVEVEYEVLPGVYSVAEALKEERPMIWNKEDVSSHTKIRRGDTDKAFEECDVIVEGDFYVPRIEHAYMEIESCVTNMDKDGAIHVFMSHQGAYDMQNMFIQSLGLPEDKVIMDTCPTGGGFGGKEEPTIHIHCALATLLTGKPCKIVMTREESMMVSTKRHAEIMHMKYGAKKDGTFHAFRGRADVESGAYDSLSGPVVFRSGVVMNGPYAVPYAHTDSIGHYTNLAPGGAFRGFGSTQVTFGAEILIDEMARKLGMDPFEIRLLNALEDGKEGITGQTMGTGIGLKKSLEKVREQLEKVKDQYKPSAPGKKIGIGIASSFKNVGIGIGLHDGAGAKMELKADGTIMLKHGAASMGQGPDTTMALIAATASGVPYSKLEVINNITPECPNGEETTASRQTFVSGNASKFAGELFKEELLKRITAAYGVDAGAVVLDADGFKAGSASGSYKELADKIGSFEVEYEYIPPQTSALNIDNTVKPGVDPVSYKIHYSYTFATHAVIAEVDEGTGEFKILRIIAANDLGKAIHPLQAEGQIAGGVAMGVGYAQSEEYLTKDGIPVTNSLVKAKLPKITDMPEMDIILIEEAQLEGPYGAKGMGELPVNPVAPALSNAIYDAIGVRVRTLPITKEKVAAELAAK